MAISNPLHPLTKDVAEQLRDQMRRMLVRLDEMRALASSSNAAGAWTPPVDICEFEGAILVRVEIPGVSIDHLRICLIDSVLKVEGRKERATPTGKLLPESERPVRFLCLERGYGNFALAVSLKWPIEAANVSAKMIDGVLHINLPKTKTCGREISVPISE